MRFYILAKRAAGHRIVAGRVDKVDGGGVVRE